MTRLHSLCSTLAVLSALAVPPLAFAGTPVLPTGGTFTAGGGSISTSGSTETVTVTNDGSIGAEPGIIDWGSFSVGAGGTVRYVPAAGGPTSGLIVNVDKSGSMSVINGTVSSPDYAQVIVNPDGISVGSTASLPAQTELAAGTFSNGYGSGATKDNVPVTITADSAPITIAKGATFAAEGTTTSGVSGGVATIASTGDTLPDSVGLSTNVMVPADKASSFTLQPGQVGNISFTGPPSGIDYTTNSIIPTAPSGVSITGPAGGTVRSLQYIEPFQVDPTTGVRLPTGTMTVSNVASTGSMLFQSGQDITLSGTVAADNGVAVSATPFQPSSSSTTPTLSIASGATLGCGGAKGCNLYGATVSIGSDVSMTGSGSVEAGAALIASSSSSPATISANGAFSFGAGSVSNLSISDAAASSNSISLDGNSVSGVSVAAPQVHIYAASYERSAPDDQPMALNDVSITSPNVTIDGAYGLSMSNVHQTMPNGTSNGYVSISGASSNGAYPASTNTANSVSISSSSFDVGGNGLIYVSAGIASGSSTPPALPGTISISGSTLSSGGGQVSVTAHDGGSIDVGSSSTLTADEAGACSGSSAACTTAILAQTVDFKSGNSEMASVQNAVAASTITGSANGSPAEYDVNTGSLYGNVELTASNGAVTIAGELDAGQATTTPPQTQPTTPPVTTPTVPSAPPAPVSPRPAKSEPAPMPSRPAVTFPTIEIVSPIQIEPSPAVTTVQQTGSTVLVPEAPASSGSPVTISASTTGRRRR